MQCRGHVLLLADLRCGNKDVSWMWSLEWTALFASEEIALEEIALEETALEETALEETRCQYFGANEREYLDAC